MPKDLTNSVIQSVLFLCVIVLCSIQNTSAFRFSIPTFTTNEWASANSELKTCLGPLHHDLGTGTISPKVTGDQFNVLVCDFLEKHPEFQEDQEINTYYKNTPQNLEQAKKAKNHLRKKAQRKDATPEDRHLLREAVRAHSFLKKQQKRKGDSKNARYLEKLYHKNFWDFASKTCSGTLQKQPEKPTFTKEYADQYYTNKYSVSNPIEVTKLNWFPHLPDTGNGPVPFDLGPIKPSEIKKILQTKNATSAPGPEGLLYGILRKLPTTHHLMGTLFSKLIVDGDPPESWSNSRISLIYKANDSIDPGNFGKVYHQIMANRTASFLIDNKIIDPCMQKAFLQGINGCIEHTQIMHDILAHAKNNNRTCHITYFDLADAFGSVEHDLIYQTMQRNGIPPVVIEYVRNLYSRLSGYVQGDEWTSEPFRFQKGVFQGDPWSPIIFLLTFNPILEYLTTLQDEYGYNLNGTRFITLPFADDFCLITAHMRHHQWIINKIIECTRSMNLVLKPVKCRSISICSGSPKEVSFLTGDFKVPTVKEKPVKFLGSYITFLGKTSEIFGIISSKMCDMLDNIDSVNIRGEYKTRIYTQYGLPSLRYILSVHSLTDTHNLKNWTIFKLGSLMNG